MKREFNPEQIIFSSTTQCNLHCPHCFVDRKTQKIEIAQAINFLETCRNTTIQKIGFSGGEPFLYPQFLFEVSKAAVEKDYLFDQIMTNGDWWKTPEGLENTLSELYNSGYDGKIGLSWDNFHNQTTERMQTFIQSVQKIFGPDSINIQYVKNDMNKGGESLPLGRTGLRPTPSSGATSGAKSPTTPQLSENLIKELFPEIPLYILPQTFTSENPEAWNANKWFTEDYCQGPGNIFYVHTDGNIAPCCGFANENPQLFIGNITQDFATIMEQARNNSYVQLCFSKGLHTKKHKVQKIVKKLFSRKCSGKTSDICTLCDFVCKQEIK